VAASPEDGLQDRIKAAIGSTVFFLLAPAIVAGLIPWWITGRHFPAPLAPWPIATLGAILAIAGLAVLVDCFVRFAWQGVGTPAPVAPTRHLVVTGAYRYVRNPMYVGVLAIILGQVLVFASLPLLIYGGLAWLATHVFVLLYEEPTLRRTYGAEYETFTAAVPRWIPRLTPFRRPP
jgi:protein-S-isoprenylcysteine O-methyltransferase Ste14